MMITRYRGTLLGITREQLMLGLSFWVVEPVGCYVEHVSADDQISHRLPVRAGLNLTDPFIRAVADLDTLEVLR